MASKIDLVTLRIFSAVAETRNFTKAAELVHIAPSALSRRISDLEENLRTSLFYRMHRGVELTPAGNALRPHAQKILEEVELLSADLSQYAEGIRGHVRMLANMTALAEFLPEDLKSFSEKYPTVDIDLVEETSPVIVQAVREGQVDIGIVSALISNPDDLEVFDYRVAQNVAIVPAGHPLADRKIIGFDELLAEPVVALDSSGWVTIMENAAAQCGCSLKLRFRLKSFEAVCRMVAAGFGVTVTSRGILSVLNPSLGIRVVELDGQWARPILKIVIRDTARLEVPARLMVEHLRPEPL